MGKVKPLNKGSSGAIAPPGIGDGSSSFSSEGIIFKGCWADDMTSLGRKN